MNGVEIGIFRENRRAQCRKSIHTCGGCGGGSYSKSEKESTIGMERKQ
jgi:hypothetical protein